MTSGIGGGGAIGVGQMSSESQNATPLTSPIRHNANIHSGGQLLGALSGGSSLAGRKRNGVGAGLDSSPGSIDDLDDGDQQDGKKRQPVKRACNECRQQKVSAIFLYVRAWSRFVVLIEHSYSASLRCNPRSVHGLLALPSSQTRLQN